ncbi:MAG: CotH kinase family protein [Verrucomicrobiales bacterium]|nr:CotH kinase family protein [Verrucomicrobiales bacterium]
MHDPSHLYTHIASALLALALPATLPGASIISEVVTDNVTSLADEDTDSPDWIELHNDGAEAVDLGGYFLSDDPDDLNKWELPTTQLPPAGHLVVFASGKNRRITGSELHTNFQLKNGGEFLALVAPDGTTIVDSFAPEIPELSQDQSYGVQRVGDDWVTHYFATPTPGATNSGGTVAEEVSFSIPGQPFGSPLQLELTSRSGGPINYTVNGTDPNGANPTSYSGPITVDSTMVIHASVPGGPVHQEVYFQINSADTNITGFSSNLPVFVLQSNGTIGTSFTPTLIGVLEPDPATGRTTFSQNFTLTSDAIARTRGSSSQAFPKKSYRLEFQDALGDGRSLKPLGFPSESDWILSGRYEEDRALVRNEFIFELSNQIGRYAPRTKFCEVFVIRGSNPLGYRDYVGAYSLTESIKRDADRIDIEELERTDTTEPDVTGGYIFKVDRGGSNDTQITGGGQSVQVTEPSRRELPPQQRRYLTSYLNAMGRVLRNSDPEVGYPAFIDVDSWVDVHMLNMLMLNVDALRLSAYYHKNRNGKIAAGPIWDFNISSGSRDRFGSPPRPSEPETWRGISGDRGTTFFTNGTQQWWGTLFVTRDFQQQYCDRWNELRKGPLSTAHMHAIIDGMAAELAEAQPRNQTKWRSVPPEYGGYQGEIDHLKDWLQTRAEWIDKELVAAPAVAPQGGALAPGTQITLTDHPRAGASPTTVYYTTDGSDPRLHGGEVSPTAIEYTGPFTLGASANLTVREHMPDYRPLRDGPDMQWSAPDTVQFIVGNTPASAGNLAVSEIMYHPANPTESEIAAGFTNDDAFEFVELTNTANTPLDLLGVSFTDGINFQFTSPTILAPGQFVVVVSNTDAFAARYGNAINVAGSYTGQLRNSGEILTVTANDSSTISSIPYDDDGVLWPAAADGGGPSLVFDLSTPGAAQSEPGNWSASAAPGGSPGTAEPDLSAEYIAWAEANFPPAQAHLSNPAADPDGDSFDNFTEFVLRGNPLSSDNPGPAISLTGDAGNTSIVVRFTRNTEAGAVTITPQSSSALGQWQTAVPTTTETTPAGAGAEQVTLTFPAPQQPGDIFVRLEIQ